MQPDALPVAQVDTCTLGASDWKGEGAGADCGTEKGPATSAEGAGDGAMWPWFSDWARARVLCVGQMPGWCAPASKGQSKL